MHTKIEDDFIKSANAFLCVFDINDENSVIKAVDIKNSYENKLGEFSNNKKWYLIANKKDKDLLDKKIPSQYKNLFNNYFEISASTSKNSEFDKILGKIVEELNLSQKENRGIMDESEMEKENFEIDFEAAHGNVFDEECKIF
jgi:predicted GTPase